MIQVFWDVTLLLGKQLFPTFRRKFCFHLQSKQNIRDDLMISLREWLMVWSYKGLSFQIMYICRIRLNM